MATSIDTNVLSYVLTRANPQLARAARHALVSSARQSALVVCGPVLAELAAIGKGSPEDLVRLLTDAGLEIDDRWDRAVWYEAARAFRTYLSVRRPAEYMCPVCGTSQRFRCRTCATVLGKPKHLLADFMIGAHAARYRHDILTNDVGVYREFFPTVRVIPLTA